MCEIEKLYLKQILAIEKEVFHHKNGEYELIVKYFVTVLIKLWSIPEKL